MPRFGALVLLAAVFGQTAPGATNLGDRGTQAPRVTVNEDVPPADASWLPPPELVLIAEKVPFELPNGQILVLFDHKVGRNRVRYEVDGIEYKPSVGAAVALPGPDYVMVVTCTRWKLPKKHYGRDSAEFQIECISGPVLRDPADIAPRSPTAVAPPMPPVHEPLPNPQIGEGSAPSFEDEMSPPGSDAGEPRILPAPHFVVLAEKRPFRLPNGQFLVLMDHKVGDDQVRYEVDRIEYKPVVGETLELSGRGFFVHVTCSRWKLLKKYYGEDSAEFLIESFPAR